MLPRVVLRPAFAFGDRTGRAPHQHSSAGAGLICNRVLVSLESTVAVRLAYDYGYYARPGIVAPAIAEVAAAAPRVRWAVRNVSKPSRSLSAGSHLHELTRGVLANCRLDGGFSPK